MEIATKISELKSRSTAKNNELYWRHRDTVYQIMVDMGEEQKQYKEAALRENCSIAFKRYLIDWERKVELKWKAIL